MDDNDNIQEGFSQEDCIEWEENTNVDLRSLARSPHMPATPALLGTQTSAKQPPRRSKGDTPPTNDLVKNLDKNYSPKQEIANLLDPAGKSQEAAAHEAPTQPQANITRSAETLGMRHGRRRRESTVTKQPKRLKRSNTDPTGRRRPRSSGSMTLSRSEHRQQGATHAGDGMDFEDLLKELDQPRIPLHPTRVNMSVKGKAKKTSMKPKPPVVVNVPTPMPESGAAATVALPTVPQPASSYPTANKISQSDDVRKQIPTTALYEAPKEPPKVHKPHPSKTVRPIVPVNLQPTTVTISDKDPQKQQANTSTGPKPPIVQDSANETPAAKETKTNSASPFFGDDLELSEEDWAKMDALTTLACRENDPTKKDNSCSAKDWKAIQAIDESLARAVGHPSVAETKQSTGSIGEYATKDDEFDDFPMFDFEAIDRQIAERSTAVASTTDPPANYSAAPSPGTPIWNPVSPTFDPHNSYIAFSRYKVVGTDVDNNTYTKTVLLKEWQTAMLNDQDRNSIHHASSLERSTSKSETDQESPDGCIYPRGEWYHTHVDAGDIVHLCSLSGKYRTDVGVLPVTLHTSPPKGSDAEDDLVLVVLPDCLIPPTTISETVTCSRRAVLRMRLGSTGISCEFQLM